MDKQYSSKAHSKLLEKAEESPGDRIWCEACGTDEFVLVERARWRRHHGEDFWDVDYFCTRCDTFYGHLVRDEDVTPALMAAMSAVKY